MDPSAPQLILGGVAITSTVCGATASLYGVFKGRAPGPLFMFTAMNSGIVAATFFSIREYMVSPILTLTHPGKQYQARRRKLGVKSSDIDESPLTWSDFRTAKLLDSSVSGALAGGILNTFKRGRPGLVPGTTTGAVLCTILQWTFNELDILRIKYASRNSPSIGAPVRASEEQSQEPIIPPVQETKSIMDRILSKFAHKMTDEEYLKRMKAQREAHLRRIAELEGDTPHSTGDKS
ncbi:hypothetical protein BJ138DRAFT_1084220 [Hygrophoropsis aurantiaca]|uniref:Uncharacterized protein n=1 Tax=Hygrophoropsis aurantiaca TaxID=72124 RepID=A0ACB8AGU0_9AGAM|nr:hypothetical protein BJ138DRAFT_1084220 [Hygrophoropsis aurantiaca]